MKLHQCARVVAALIFASSCAMAQPATDHFGANLELKVKAPMDLVHTADTALFMCRLAFSLSNSQADLARGGTQPTPEDIARADYMRCITEHKARITKAHALAAKLTKRPAAKKELREFATLAAITLDGIAPMAGEIRLDYERRINSEKRDLDKQRARLEAALQ